MTFKKLIFSRFVRLFRFSSDQRTFNNTFQSKMLSLIKNGVDTNKIRLFAFLSELPLTDKISQESKVFDELFSQILDIYSSLENEKVGTEDHQFYSTELEQTTATIEEEYNRILTSAIEGHFKSEIDDIEGAKLEFRAGVGGAEALLFADEMSHYYSNYLIHKGYKIEFLTGQALGGKVVSFKAKGEGVYKLMIHESGVHKVIRVPETERQGRLHSSTISLVVLPDVPFEFKLNEKELRYDYMRAQGPGGQHVNKTESACRITHVPTGLAVLIQEDRSQAKNRELAFEIIREKLYQLEFDKKMGDEMEKRKTQIGSGDRSDKIRTFNFPQDRITDHRLGKTVFGIKNVLNSGEIFDECIEAMTEIENKKRIADFNAMLAEKYKF